MSFLFATTNADKLRDAREILQLDIQGVALDLPEPQALDVAEVAAAKALAAREALGNPDLSVLVEDSGIVFGAWNGLPGALTKWFLGSVGNEGLLRMLMGEADRSARAVCAVAAALPEGGAPKVFVGEVEGRVADAPRGDGGFGWDGIFVPEGGTRTYAEMGAAKNADSHRARALRAARSGLSSVS